MKAKTPDVSKVVEEMCQISVYRAQLLCMMAMQDTKGISERMINEVIMRWQGRRESNNVEDRRNRPGGPSLGGPGFRLPRGKGGIILLVVVALKIIHVLHHQILTVLGKRDVVVIMMT